VPAVVVHHQLAVNEQHGAVVTIRAELICSIVFGLELAAPEGDDVVVADVHSDGIEGVAAGGVRAAAGREINGVGQRPDDDPAVGERDGREHAIVGQEGVFAADVVGVHDGVNVRIDGEVGVGAENLEVVCVPLHRPLGALGRTDLETRTVSPVIPLDLDRPVAGLGEGDDRDIRARRHPTVPRELQDRGVGA